LSRDDKTPFDSVLHDKLAAMGLVLSREPKAYRKVMRNQACLAGKPWSKIRRSQYPPIPANRSKKHTKPWKTKAYVMFWPKIANPGKMGE
jgi:hypothetical protein